MTSHKALIHIGGSFLQLPSIRWAKELGLHVVLTDWNPDVPGRLLADEYENIGGTDIPALLELAHRVNNEYTLIGAYASSDFGLPAVAAITEAFSLPGCSQLAVKRALDKPVSKDIWLKNDLPTPKGKSVKTLEELHSAVDELGLPLILKPTDSCGSQGISSIRRIEDVQQMFIAAQRFSDTVLVELLVSGHHVDVNGLFNDGIFFPCGTMERYFCEPPYHYPIWGCQPSSLNETQEREAYTLVEQAARVLGIESGPVKADLIWTDDGPVIIEMGPRFHGDVGTAYVTVLATDQSPIKAWFAFLKGDPDFELYLPNHCKQYAGWIGLFPSKIGHLKSIDNIDYVRRIPRVHEVYLRANRGIELKPHKDNTTLCGFIWASGIDKGELYEILMKACLSLRYVVE